MTPEQRRHQEEFFRAKGRYENAVYEKRRAENEIANIVNRRNQLINEINGLNSEKRRNESSLSELNKAASRNNDLESGIRDMDDKLSTAAAGFLAVGESSVGNPPNLVDVFDEQTRSTKAKITAAFDQIRSAASAVNTKINQLASKIRSLESELEQGRNRERQLRYIVSEQQWIINNSSIEMAYHKRLMYA